MKFLAVCFPILILISQVHAQESSENPIESLVCEAGSEHGFNIHFKLKRNLQFGELKIKRQKATSDYTKDLSHFNGGNYRLDLNPKGGFNGYSLQYRPINSQNWLTAQGNIDCPENESPKEKQTSPSTI